MKKMNNLDLKDLVILDVLEYNEIKDQNTYDLKILKIIL